MKMLVKFAMDVRAETPEEEPAAERMRAEIHEMAVRPPGRRRRVKFDECLVRDFVRVLGDLRQLMNRADARRRKR